MSGHVAYLLSQKKQTSHLIHALLTIFTGVWGIVWICAALSNSLHNRKIDSKIERVLMGEAIRNV